ncbi:ABC transporter substrate-binding protein [Glaciibacter psychrotolerans]|uniref:Polar amino acid transport system substrate-binding protein n=1 Tax=Glaciibacter psychrotolerans TaxID=670054 RepID=A0A7Z0J6Z3_9MICO|nr:ABC transporter substrate-binding protein [Leifsonia psychrotolerans]NYJ20438.1 polar amino acid transport system substrate-binding protein [Leifsonia psychrotolerans]
MKNAPFRLTALAVVALGSLLLTGCGGQSLAGAADAGAPAAAVKNTIPSGDLAGSVLKGITQNADFAARVPANIKTNGLKVATADGYPPMEMFDTDGKTMVGVDMSLVRAIADSWGVKVEIINSDVNSMMPGVASGRFDVLASGFNDTEVRREKASFVDYARSSGAIIVAKGNPEGITAPTDLCGHTMAVLDNGYYMQLTTTFSEDCVAAGQAPIEILGFANDPEALLQLQSGRAQAGMNDYPVGVFRAKEAGGAIEAIEIPGNSLFGIAVDPKNTELITLIQDTVNQLIADGDYDKILAAWDLSGMAVTEATVNQGK